MSQGPHTSRGHVPRHTSTSNDTDDATRILSPQTLADNDSADADATVPLSSIQFSYETDDDATEFLNLQDLPSSSPDMDATRAIPNPHEAPKPRESSDTVALDALDDSPTEAISASQDPRAHYVQHTRAAQPQTRVQPDITPSADYPATVAMPTGAPGMQTTPPGTQYSAAAHPHAANPTMSAANYAGYGARPNPAAPGAGVPVEAPIPNDPPSTKVVAQHLGVMVLFGALLYATFQFFIYSRTGQQLDENAFTEYASQFAEYQRPTLAALDNLPTITGVIAVIGIIIGLIWKHRILPAIVGILAGTGACLSVHALKNYVVTKPNFGIQEALLNSAPSGHTAFAASAGAALFIAAPRALRPTIAVLAAMATCATGASTIINGWHRPADVISAILVVALWTVLGLGVLRYLRRAEFNAPTPRVVGAIAVPLLTIASLFLSFCAVAMYAVTMFSTMPGGVFVASTCLILAVSTGTTAILVRLLRPRNQVSSPYTRVWEY